MPLLNLYYNIWFEWNGMKTKKSERNIRWESVQSAIATILSGWILDHNIAVYDANEVVAIKTTAAGCNAIRLDDTAKHQRCGLAEKRKHKIAETN